ncbi:MAG: LPP20 family lipoprotein [Nitrospira sp.]|nr:LPP20 family lipoprotein [Nitrospira sp.]MDH4243263.1 LPP20 family lipoprotein [Nitrospira sp.]MDH4357063.1 LPP20 family lipoprotein [Nitrospira sp.]MDH5317392.1 LPP20 family lipoprotein [Nitrospira sp.]
MKTKHGLMTQGMTILSALVLLIMTPTLVSSKSEDVVVTTPNGSINWTAGIATARGIGIPPKNPVNSLQAKEMTRKAAWAVALANLLEVVKGVHVDSTTTVNNYVATNDEVRTRVEGFIKGARLVKEDPLPDGSYETTVEMKLAGEFSELVVPKTDPKNAPLKRYQKNSAQTPKVHTGLVVDAQGLSARPALAPRLLNKDGEEVYSVAYVDRQATPSDRIVSYESDPASAQLNPLVTNAPLTIKAVRAKGADLYISDADAQTLHGVPKYFQFLKQAKVAVVLDKNGY